MACCFFAAFCISRLIAVCEKLDISMKLQLKDSYSAFSSGDSEYRQVTTRVTVYGMTCGACSEAIERNLRNIKGVSNARAVFQMQRVTIVHDQDVSLGILKQAIEDAGFEVGDQERSIGEKINDLRFSDEIANLRVAFYGSIAITAIIVAAERLMGAYPVWNQVSTGVLALFLQWKYGWWIHDNTWRKAKRRVLSMDTLITVSIAMGISLSFFNILVFGIRNAKTYFRMSCALVMIVSGGRYLDLISRRETGDSTAHLYGLVQQTQMVALCPDQDSIPASLLEVGDQIIIAPYTVIPCDSYVIEGASDVNESLVTGESLPVSKEVGDFLLAGTRNHQSSMKAIVQKDQKESFLMNLIESVANATESKVGIEKMVGFVTQYFVAAIILLSFIRGVGLFFLTNTIFTTAVRLNIAATAAMTVLTAACPCALGLSTPSAIMAGLDAARSRGILITGGASTMEAMQRINHVIFDKTGTLTTGTLEVTTIHIDGKWKQNWKVFNALVCAAEERTAPSHPVAQAVFKSLLQDIIEEWNVYKAAGSIQNLVSVGGQGISCTVDLGDGVSHEVHVGNAKMMDNSCIPCKVDTISSHGLQIYIAVDGEYSGTIMLADSAKSDASNAISKLRSRCLSISMLTGDLAPEASRISQGLSINVLASSSSPKEKQSHIQVLQSREHNIAMIGDGINDAPSLAAADVGIMLSHGHSCFTTGGQVLILSPRLSAIPALFDIAEQTMMQVRWNLIWAAGYNILAVGLAMGAGSWCGVVLTPEISATMMAMSSVSIGYQSMRLRKRLMSDT